jgi:hypothetical protein
MGDFRASPTPVPLFLRRENVLMRSNNEQKVATEDQVEAFIREKFDEFIRTVKVSNESTYGFPSGNPYGRDGRTSS